MTLTRHPQPHTEKHFTDSEAVRDIVISMSDGLAEMATEAIAMGLG